MLEYEPDVRRGNEIIGGHVFHLLLDTIGQLNHRTALEKGRMCAVARRATAV